MVQDVSVPAPGPCVAFVSGGLKLGGATTFLCNLGGELVRRGIPSKVFSFEQANPLGSDFERLNLPVLSQDERRLIFEDRVVAILQQLREFRPTAVVACLSAVSFEVLRYVPKGVFRIGMVQSHDPAVYQMVRFYPGEVDLMAGVSQTIRETLEAMPEFARVRVEYLPYGVPMPEAAPPSALHANGALRILYLGRLEQEQKRVRLFPAILDQLRSSGIPFHWTIAGEGPEKAFLQAEMKGSSDQTVSFPGQISYRDVPQVLRDHNVFLLASDYEGLPLSLLEAMAGGLVPVVSDLSSGIREVVDETTGRRVATDDLDGYAQAIIWLSKNRAEMARLAQNGREKVWRDFSVGAMSNRWLDVLPGETKASIVWPKHWLIKPPLVAPKDFRYSQLGRVLRRIRSASADLAGSASLKQAFWPRRSSPW